ncbi:MAG: sugar transferase [Lachnospiraceae bacterium]|nr:sugar transferase [Lachnospiraceae bacterium]
MQSINRKGRLLETYSLILIDLLCVIAAVATALLLRFGNVQQALTVQVHYTVGIYMMLFSLLYNVLADWNRGFFKRGYFVEFVAVVKYDIVMMAAIACIMYMTHVAGDYSRLTFGYFAVANLIYTMAAHCGFKNFMLKFYQKSNSSDKVMVVTEGDYAEELIKRILASKPWNYEVTSIAILDSDFEGEEIMGIPVVAGKHDLFEVSRQMPLDQVFMYLPGIPAKEVRSYILDFQSMGVVCHYNVEMKELNLSGKTAGDFAGYAVMTFSMQYFDYRRMIVKRFIDICGGLVGSLITILMTPFVALAIKIESRGPVFFAQTRIGKNGRRFKIYKFRSMYIDAEERKKELAAQNEMSDGLMFKMENDPRITKVGWFIRKTSIDEFPQFFNILKGDMSLVGTRPPTEDEFEQYSNHYRRRMSITPGLTGMWQVKGRGKVVDFEDVVKLDLEYIDHWSLTLDFKILFQTVGVVLFGRGAK